MKSQLNKKYFQVDNGIRTAKAALDARIMQLNAQGAQIQQNDIVPHLDRISHLLGNHWVLLDSPDDDDDDDG